jgi:hypothetical protein
MKPKKLLLIILLTMSGLPLWAQKGMHIAPLFRADYSTNDKVVEVYVEGKELKPYKLTRFRSLTFTDCPEEIAKMEKLVRADGAEATEKSMALVGGRLSYGYFRFEGVTENRLIFYRSKPGDKPEAILVFMEGSATLDEIKAMFK